MLLLNTVTTANGQRASIALSECGLDYAVRKVDLLSGEHRNDDLLAINPVGRMPVLSLRDDASRPDFDLYGSLAIATWASEHTGLLAPAAEYRIEYHEWIGILMTDLAPAFATHFYLDVLANEPQTWGVECFASIIDRLLNVIEGRLAQQQYVVGESFTVADVMLYPMAASSLSRFPDGLAQFPALKAWKQRISEREGVKQGMQASS